MLNEEDLQQKIIEMRPWGHEILLPYNLVTARPPYHEEHYPGEKNYQVYRSNQKFVKLEKAGAFDGIYPPGIATPPSKIIDIGCGTGWFALHLAQQGCEVVAIDISLKAIEKVQFLREVFELKNLVPLRGDFSTLRYGFSGYDLILVLGLLHHLCEEERIPLLRYCYRSLGLHGVIVIETKPEMPCEELLRQAEFVPRKLRGAPRSSWRGEKKSG